MTEKWFKIKNFNFSIKITSIKLFCLSNPQVPVAKFMPNLPLLLSPARRLFFIKLAEFLNANQGVHSELQAILANFIK